MAPTFSVSINLGCCVKTVSASFIWPYFGTSPPSAERWRLLNEYCFLNFRRWFVNFLLDLQVLLELLRTLDKLGLLPLHL